MTTITIQPGQPGEGMRYDVMKPLPYPYHVDAKTGEAGRQEFWRGDPAVLLGFQEQADTQRVDLFLTEWVTDPQKAVGMFPAFARTDGSMYTLMVPITSVFVNAPRVVQAVEEGRT